MALVEQSLEVSYVRTSTKLLGLIARKQSRGLNCFGFKITRFGFKITRFGFKITRFGFKIIILWLGF